MKGTLMLLILTALLVGCAKSEPVVVKVEKIDGAKGTIQSSQQMSTDYLAQLIKQNPEKNLMISAYSIYNCAGMVRLGALGESEAELQKFLKTSLPAKAVGDEVSRIKNGLRSLENADVLREANAIWVRKSYEVKPEFLKQAEELFSAKVAKADFPSPALEEINRFTDEVTRGRIPKVIDNLYGDVAMVLVNAISFKDGWSVPFKPEFTKPMPFKIEGSPTVSMMNNAGYFACVSKPTFDGVSIP